LNTPIRCTVVGATGYTGLELVRFLVQHPSCQISHLLSSSKAGVLYSDIYPQFQGLLDLELEAFVPNQLPTDTDVLFLAMPHGEVHPLAQTIREGHPDLLVIDLSADFRLSDPMDYPKYYGTEHTFPELLKNATYGLPELYKEEIKTANWVANPGCYATAVILGIHPLAKANQLSASVIIDAKSGVSGSGKGLKVGSLYCEATEAITAYGTGDHRHFAEMKQELGFSDFLFSPHLIPQSRGILASIYVTPNTAISETDLVNLYEDIYKDDPFVKISRDLKTPSTKSVTGTNNCVITPRVMNNGNIVVFSAIDNLIKGAAGQAIQNMNIRLGLDESEGLPTLGWHL
jgi:N-acetyl-gamma-glutamyl-phosphate reductase